MTSALSTLLVSQAAHYYQQLQESTFLHLVSEYNKAVTNNLPKEAESLYRQIIAFAQNCPEFGSRIPNPPQKPATTETADNIELDTFTEPSTPARLGLRRRTIVKPDHA